MPVTVTPPVDRLDTVPADEFAAAVAPLFEGAPRFLARLAAARPFREAATMFERARAIAHAMPEDEQIELVDAHPRLGAPPGSVSALSFREQGYDRDAAEVAAEGERTRVATELDRLNDLYEERFGFRYCTWVAGRPRQELLHPMAAALDGDRATELHRALDAVVDIAADRYRLLSQEDRG